MKKSIGERLFSIDMRIVAWREKRSTEKRFPMKKTPREDDG
jgi:hypothetical protein